MSIFHTTAAPRAELDPEPRGPLRDLALRAGSGGLLLALALAAGGCSVKSADNANLIAGKQAFVAKCGSCHALARADTKGVVGPNLDDAFRASLAEGLERNSVRGVVEGQVLNPDRDGVMPKDIAGGATLRNIAAYVADAVDRSGKDKGLLATAVQAPGSGKPAVEKAGELQLDASPSGQLLYTATKAEAKPGPVTLVMGNTSGVSHNIAVESGAGGASGSGAVLGSSPYTTKTTATVSVNLKPGTYTFFCEATGHRVAGMYGTLTVK
ncbi:MAG TPA: plastocyanin/azurin family copper-binding protein [Solirubrobacteraceae bacterium]|nr:plastocyanin/azurin family copper-binding protein [Solirubrobacteraceae bacterium]